MNKLFAFAENPRCAILFLILLGAVMFLPGFYTIPPIDRDEARFAQASKQMIESGNYFDIHFQNEVRYKKPVGIYWLQVASTKIFGAPPFNQIWTYRVPSFLAAIASLMLTYLIGRNLISSQVGFGAALLLSSALILSAEARLAKTDAILLATTLFAMWQLAKVYIADDRSGRVNEWSRIIIFWLAIAAGILIKGPVILMVVGLTVVTLCILQKSPQLFLQLRPLIGLGIIVLCIAPWLIAITIQSHGLFWQESIGHDMLGKVSAGQESHGLPPGTHMALLLILFLPAIVPVVRGLLHGWQTRGDRVTQFLLAWIIPSWLIFEIIPTKLPHYTLPMYPAIALLAATALSKVNFSDRRQRLAFAIPIAIALALNIKLLGFIAPSLPNFWIAPQLQQIAQGRPVILVGYEEPSAIFLLGTKTQWFGDAKSALNAWEDDDGALLIVSNEKLSELKGLLKITHTNLNTQKQIRGMNLGRGRMETLYVFQYTDFYDPD